MQASGDLWSDHNASVLKILTSVYGIETPRPIDDMLPHPRNRQSRSGICSPISLYHFGIGIDTALPTPRSATQIVSPAGSTPVGVSSPSLITVITVTPALSPFTVCLRDSV